MQQVRRASARGSLAALCAAVLFLQATAVPIVHVLHWSGAIQVAADRDAVASCCPQGHGPALERAGTTAPQHDSNACPTCALLAQYRSAAIAAPNLRPAPALQGVRPAAAERLPASRAARVAAGPRAPPLRCA